jgi:hypothetical protein
VVGLHEPADDGGLGWAKVCLLHIRASI